MVSEEDRNTIHQAIDLVHTEIAQLKELERIKGDHEATRHQRLACETFTSTHEKLLHWTRRLPIELLIHIFFCCTEDNTIIPWSITHVCRKWRSIALSVPRLWRKVPMRSFKPEDRHIEEQFLRFLSEDYLKRSGNETLIFSLVDRGDEASHRRYDILLEHTERWGGVELCLQVFQPTQGIDLTRLEGRLQSLYSLNLVLHCLWGRPNMSWMVFEGAPRLRHLRIDGLHCLPDVIEDVNDVQSFKLGWLWRRVTHFYDADRPPALLSYRTLRQFENLVYMELSIDDRFTKDIGEPSLVFRACKYLHLRLGQKVVWQGSAAVNRLRFPVLEHLHISYSNFTVGGRAAAHFTEFIQRHSAGLVSIHWEYKTSSPFFREGKDVTLARVFGRGLPQLRVLRFTDLNTPTLNEALSSLVINWELVPSLRQLDCRFHSDLARDDLPGICEKLNDLVQFDMRRGETGTLVGGRLDEIRLETPDDFKPIQAPHRARWDLISGLEGWSDDLQDDWEGQMKLDYQLKDIGEWKEALQRAFDNFEKRPARDIESLLLKGVVYEVTDVLVLHDTGIHRLLQKFVDRECRSPTLSPSCIKFIRGMLQGWSHMFLDQAPSRRWATSGEDRVLYVPLHSPWRRDPSTWSLGVFEDDRGFRYLGDDHAPKWDLSCETLCEHHM